MRLSPHQDLSRVPADFKRHTARRLIEHLEAEGCDWLLNPLRHFRAAHKVESEYQLWQEGSHPQAILSDEMMPQKLDYLHNNPVKRGLVARPSTGFILQRTSGCPARRQYCAAIRGGSSEAQLPGHLRSQVQLGEQGGWSLLERAGI